MLIHQKRNERYAYHLTGLRNSPFTMRYHTMSFRKIDGDITERAPFFQLNVRLCTLILL